jgi:hypothetical protein
MRGYVRTGTSLNRVFTAMHPNVHSNIGNIALGSNVIKMRRLK